MMYTFNITKSLFAIVALIPSVSLNSCDSPYQPLETIEQRVSLEEQKKLKAYYAHITEVINFKKATSEKLIANQKLINDFKISRTNENKYIIAVYKEPIEVLNRKNTDLEKRMSEYKEDGSEKWKSFKSQFCLDMDELGQSLNDVCYQTNN